MQLTPTVQTVIDNGNRLFKERASLLFHWQELAELFYYERADFTAGRNIGEDYADGSVTSIPALARREMGNIFRAMLRPRDFFKIKATDEKLNEDSEARAWLEYATKLQQAVMYRRGAGFMRATVAGDHDYVTFGNAVIEVCTTPDRSALFFANHHLRDCAWSVDYAGNVQDVHRDCSLTLSQLNALFPKTIPAKLTAELSKDPYKRVKVRHVVVPSDAYDLGIPVRRDHPFASLWVMPDDGEVLEKITRTYRGYIVPRAETVSGSQYARSPFTSIILPDARTKAAIERILLEAGEKAIDPPMVAQEGAVRTDMALYAGGVTWVDQTYDERLGEVIRPLMSDKSGLPFGEAMSERYDRIIENGMMLNKINLPADLGQMTAYEVRKRMEQHMRAHIPLFEPVEVEYNEPLCAETFQVMRSLGAFPANEIPQSLRGADVDYSFVSPIKDLEDDGKAQKFAEGMQVITAAAQLDPAIAQMPDAREIVKDTLRSLGWPSDWIKDDKRIDDAMKQMADMAQQDQQGQALMGIAEAAGKAAPMVKAVSEAQRAA